MTIGEASRQFQNVLEGQRAATERSCSVEEFELWEGSLRDAERVLVDAWVVYETDGWTHA